MDTTTQIEKLTAAGLTARLWEKGGHVRVYVSDRGRELGYLVPSDDGSTGTCRGISRRAGYVASILRGQR